MSDEPTKPGPRVTPPAEAAAAQRQERLAAALRANLARRKAQARGREAAKPGAGHPEKGR